MSGADIAAEIAAAIAEAGSEVGSGSPLTGHIIRRSGADESTYPPTPGSLTSYSCTLLLSEYSLRDRQGANITARDLRALISPDAASDPRIGDRLQFQGKEYSIINVDAVNPGGTILMWECQVRRGED